MKTRSMIAVMAVSAMLIGQVFVGNSYGQGSAAGNGRSSHVSERRAAAVNEDATIPPIAPIKNGKNAHRPADAPSVETVTVSGTVSEISSNINDGVTISTGAGVFKVSAINPAELRDSLKDTAMPKDGDVMVWDMRAMPAGDSVIDTGAGVFTVSAINPAELRDSLKDIAVPKDGDVMVWNIRIGDMPVMPKAEMMGDMKINTGTEIVTICGLGPATYWEELGIAMPKVGDEITVDGNKVKAPDNSQIIFATKITIGDKQVSLIDTATGIPLWMKAVSNPA